MPAYIALRFNLRITLVHRGLLLGTGPLVDPGFEGRLLIPLHNLTSEDCVLTGGEGLIWIEFTKLSANKAWSDENTDYSKDLETRKGIYENFRDDKKNLTPEKYLSQASPHSPIVSSIPYLLEQSTRLFKDSDQLLRRLERDLDTSLTKFKDDSKETLSRFEKYGTYGAIILVIALAAMAWPIAGLVNDSNNYATNLRKDLDATERKFDNQVITAEKNNERIKLLESEILAIKKRLPK